MEKGEIYNLKANISIIIPVYNREKEIQIALDSLLRQSYLKFEVLIVDDGSTDKTSQIVKRYCEQDLRFKYFFQNNAGVSTARNKGIKEARGEYICFLDSDDYFADDYLEKMYKQIKKYDCEVCYCGANAVTPEKYMTKSTKFRNGSILKEYILGKVAVATPGWLIKKSILKKFELTFVEGVSWGEDIEFFFSVLLRTNKVCSVKEYLVYYTVDYKDFNHLSAYSIEKTDKDVEYIYRIIKKQNLSPEIRKLLIDYRLSAQITYRLLNAFKYNIDEKIIFDYYQKYKKYILKLEFINGLRSLKLFINKLILLCRIKKIQLLNKFMYF